METAKLKKFAQFARRSLMEQIAAKLKQVLADNSPARRENTKAISQLEKAVRGHGKEQVIERVAYTWFNRFCALRFMDVNRYTRIGIVSPAEGQFQPEILAEAKMGHIDENMVNDKIRQQIFALLDGKSPSHDPQGEAYRLLLVAACNSWHRAMSFLFEEINDYTELLMPDDLLSGNSILAHTREAMTPDVCEGVEVIGWLYQFYISEKKDAVFAGLKKNKKITPENIPAATQLFTPHWIVRYLVENSLGRLWMLNHPNSRLIEKMEYYIKPEQPETDFLRITKPEEIKFCDPACGSGHILAYAFDLFYAMYEEEGYEPAEIPGKILTHNLYGIEIDDRAGALAAFALTMKARTRHRRFFRKPIEPNICVLKNVQFDDKEISEYMDFIGWDLFTTPLQTTLRQFEEADNFGSLIRPDITDVKGLMKILESKNIEGHMFLNQTHQKALQVLWQADYLSPKYHVVVANPPYMGGKGMNKSLADWIKKNYSEVKSDLFSAFILRILGFVNRGGFVGLMTPFTWMFLKSFAPLRKTILRKTRILGLVQPEYHSFFDSAYVPVCAFNIEVRVPEDTVGIYIDLGQFYGAALQPIKAIEAIRDSNCSWRYSINQAEFSLIPGEPVAFAISNQFRKAFRMGKLLSDIAEPRQGLATANNDRYLRAWYETDRGNMRMSASKEAAISNLGDTRWVPYQKGGAYRKWYGNHELVIDWRNNGYELKNDPKAVIRNPNYYFKEGMSWTSLTVASFNGRYCPEGFVFDSKGPVLFPKKETPLGPIIGLMNSLVATRFLKVISPTMDFSQGPVGSVPFRNEIWSQKDRISMLVDDLIKRAQSDWNSYETSWDFTTLPLLNVDCLQRDLNAIYQKLRTQWQEMTLEMQRLEEENNCIFINAYGLQDELTPEVPLKEITLTCNPHYRYGGNKSEEELEALLLADTIRELISYAVGCMFGRYSLDKPGLILANQGETIEDFLKQVPEPVFTPDKDNVIPLLDADWFSDDITERFKQFLRVTFGEEHYEENLTFIEQALNIKGKRSYTLRDYFLGEFYSDHVRRYKKRPIYWLFSSPKGSFNALIYMHRYQPYTASTVLSYLRDFKNEKLRAHKNQLEAVSISASASKSEKAKALKEVEKVNKIITELDAYERDILYPLATKQVEIDLDDGVKVNYPKLGAALKKIPGLS
jgi:type II restriction/modification system DNA methylase subunit YeeA